MTVHSAEGKAATDIIQANIDRYKLLENRPALPIGTFLWNAKRRTIRGRISL
jgi:hypothetical protein